MSKRINSTYRISMGLVAKCPSRSVLLRLAPSVSLVHRCAWDLLASGISVWEPYRADILNETNLVEVSRKYGATLDTMTQEFYYKAITGEIDVDAEWDDFVAQYMKNGGNEELAELKKCPIVSEIRKGKLVY